MEDIQQTDAILLESEKVASNIVFVDVVRWYHHIRGFSKSQMPSFG